MKSTVTERFWAKVDRRGPDECWEWTASSHPRTGHGRFGVSATEYVYAHRYSYALAHGAVPAGKVVCHECDNPLCVNPAHLTAATQKYNLRGMHERGRAPIGQKHYRARLSEVAVKSIRSDARTHVVIAADYGVTRECVSRIKQRRNWKHVE